MAARAKYPASHEQLFALARKAKTRGLSFDEFWQLAVRPDQPAVTWATPAEERPRGCVVWPRDTQDRNISIAATKGAREGWLRAYQGLPPSRHEAALNVLRPGLAALATVGAERASAELEAAAA